MSNAKVISIANQKGGVGKTRLSSPKIKTTKKNAKESQKIINKNIKATQKITQISKKVANTTAKTIKKHITSNYKNNKNNNCRCESFNFSNYCWRLDRNCYNICN